MDVDIPDETIQQRSRAFGPFYEVVTPSAFQSSDCCNIPIDVQRSMTVRCSRYRYNTLSRFRMEEVIKGWLWSDC